MEVIEAPRILAVDGTAASINVGAEVPVTSASFGNPLQSGTTNFVNSIQFRPTGTTLLIIPRISASGIVAMDIVLEVSSATGPALTPTINRSYLQTSLIIRDGQTVGMGGMISDHKDESQKPSTFAGGYSHHRSALRYDDEQQTPIRVDCLYHSESYPHLADGSRTDPRV